MVVHPLLNDALDPFVVRDNPEINKGIKYRLSRRVVSVVVVELLSVSCLEDHSNSDNASWRSHAFTCRCFPNRLLIHLFGLTGANGMVNRMVISQS